MQEEKSKKIKKNQKKFLFPLFPPFSRERGKLNQAPFQTFADSIKWGILMAFSDFLSAAGMGRRGTLWKSGYPQGERRREPGKVPQFCGGGI